MHFGFVFPNIGEFSDSRKLAELAHLAEEKGWDGVFVNDTMQMYGTENAPVSDPWIAMAAIAMRTERVKIGPWVTAPTRRRPWKMARETVTLDHLSNGRLILAVGLGDTHDRGYPAFGEELDIKKRAAMLDEGLDILQGLWSGQPFSYNGEHYHVDEITFLPKPVQSPRIPIWIGWIWPKKKPLNRVARWDGGTPYSVDENGEYKDMTPDDIRQIKLLMEERRPQGSPFDIVALAPLFEAAHNEQARAEVKSYAEAGATWALQYITEPDIEKVRASILQGPPSLK